MSWSGLGLNSVVLPSLPDSEVSSSKVWSRLTKLGKLVYGYLLWTLGIPEVGHYDLYVDSWPTLQNKLVLSVYPRYMGTSYEGSLPHTKIRSLTYCKTCNPCHANFQPTNLLDTGCWHKFKYWMANSADPDQLASREANRSGSTLFAKAWHNLVSAGRVKICRIKI